jgi:hypothetical protein
MTAVILVTKAALVMTAPLLPAAPTPACKILIAIGRSIRERKKEKNVIAKEAAAMIVIPHRHHLAAPRMEVQILLMRTPP